MTDDVQIRRATVDDIDDLVRLRRLMFEAMGFEDKEKLDAADAAAREYFTDTIPKEIFYGWLSTTSSGENVASGGVVIDHHPPGPANLTGKIGYIMNLVTVPEYRRQGVAREIIKTMIEWIIDQEITVMALHATEMGEKLYRELGFEVSNEMCLKITPKKD